LKINKDRTVKSKNSMSGLTLIELLIVLVIIGILTAISVPAYQGSVHKAGRTAAKGGLMDVAMRQEQFFMNNKTYSTTLANLGLPDPYFLDKTTAQVAGSNLARVYKLTLANTSSTAYDAVATAVLHQSTDGCGNYKLTSNGTRSVTGVVGTAACW
jgi:type IV pilus assembly protein PilE